MKLYEISESYAALFGSLESITDDEELTPEQRAEREQAWFDTLEMLEDEFTQKAENIAAYIKQIKAEADVLKAEEQALAKRRRAKEKHVEGLKAYLLGGMQSLSLQKLDTPMARITVRNNAEAPVFADERSFIGWAQKNNDELLRFKDPEIDKTAVKRFLQSGGVLEGVTLGRSQSLMIK